MPFALVCPGGGYNRQWTLVEGLPIAWQLSQMGYHAFILLYRSGKIGLLPDPLEDIAQSLQVIAPLAESCHFTTGNYAVCGFSAGGNLAALWGTRAEGYARYGAPRPAAGSSPTAVTASAWASAPTPRAGWIRRCGSGRRSAVPMMGNELF